MTNKIPYISSFGRLDITQEVAETEIHTSNKVYESYVSYIDTLESQLKIQDSFIKSLEKKHKRSIDFLFISNVFVAVFLLIFMLNMEF